MKENSFIPLKICGQSIYKQFKTSQFCLILKSSSETHIIKPYRGGVVWCQIDFDSMFEEPHDIKHVQPCKHITYLKYYLNNHIVVVQWHLLEDELSCWSRSGINFPLVRNYQFHICRRRYGLIAYGPFKYLGENLSMDCTSHQEIRYYS